MKILNKRVLFCFLAFLVLCGITVVMLVYNNPTIYTNILFGFKKYPSIVRYYNSQVTEKDKKVIDFIITNEIDNIFNACCNFDISYEDAERVLLPFEKINDDSIRSKAQSHLKYLKIEKVGNENLSKAETYFANNEYLKVLKCLDDVDASYSCYKSLQDICNESIDILLKKLGTPTTEDEYKKAINVLDNYISETNIAVFIEQKSKLEKELSDYIAIRDVIQNATVAFQSKEYKKCFLILDEGKMKYPDSNKLKYAISSYQYAYILTVTGQTEEYISNKKTDDAIKLLNEAIDNYDCIQFHELLEDVKRKDSILYNIGASITDARNYLFRSTKKLVLGDFSKDEDETILSLGGSIAASIAGVDAPLDARDLAYDISHWGEGDYFAARLALDVVGVIPVLGALKYLKHADTLSDVTKSVKKITDATDVLYEAAKVTDKTNDVANAMDNISDMAKVADAVHDMTNTADTVHDVTNVADTVRDFANAADKAEDVVKIVDKQVEEIVLDVTKKADIVPDLADDFKDITKAVDKAEDVADTALDISKKGGSYSDVFIDGEGDLFEVHHIPADSVTDLKRDEGPAIKMVKSDHKQTASWGASMDALKYRKAQKELIEQGNFLDAVMMDIEDIRSKFGDKYNDAIEEMLDYITILRKEGKIYG